MLRCIVAGGSSKKEEGDDSKKQGMKSLSSQMKGMALKTTSGATSKCNPCSHPKPKPKQHAADQDTGLDKFNWSGSYSRTTSSSARMEPPLVLVEETEPKEWVAQVEPGVLITFHSLPRGGNHLKRIRFSREKFNKGEAQKWWTDNYEKVMELYNVQKLNQHEFPLPTPFIRSQDESSMGMTSKVGESVTPVTPPLSRERLPHVNRGYSSSDSFDQLSSSTKQHSFSSMRSSSNASSELETEWVEEDEPGVYITIRALPGGTRELRRVRFSREQFGEMHARLWWEENRARVHEHYL